MKRFFISIAAVLIVTVFFAFKNSQGGSNTGDTISVKGKPPAFTWSGNGGKAYSLTVRTSTFDIYWQITCSDGTACIKSPLTYGAASKGTIVVAAPKPLKPGITYIVSGVGGKYDGVTSDWPLYGEFTAP
ncbi:MAG: hypothetical protein HY026_05900 [Deltaproteobacteria bacterium]|nr:hypothetical protein [Deltaproteobacteria bacterium]